MRRAELMGQGVYCKLKDRSLSITDEVNADWATSSNLALLAYHDQISNEQYRAGITYAKLRMVLFGVAAARQSALAKVIAENLIVVAVQGAKGRAAEELTEEDRAERLAEMRGMYNRGDDALRRMVYFRRVREFVRRVCVDDAPLDASRPRQLLRLREGLTVLFNVWRKEIGE